MSYEAVSQIKAQMSNCTEAELRELNHSIIERLHVMERRTALSFNINDRVWFKTRSGLRYDGVVQKINARTVKIETVQKDALGKNQVWTVSANLVNHVIENGAIARV